MTSLSARARKDRLLKVFARTGGAGSRTRPFDELPEDVREQVRVHADLREGEEPILASYQEQDHWLLLTSDRLIAKHAFTETRLNWAEIADATIELEEARNALARSGEGKLQLRRLRIMRANGSTFDIELEPGPSFIAFWNVLKTVAALKSPA